MDDGDNKYSKRSLGVACIARIDGQLKILMISKRYSYGFADLVHGKYSTDENSLQRMFDSMYLEDKICALTLDYAKLYYRIWLGSPLTSHFYALKRKFDTNFIYDGGHKLRAMIERSRTARPIWEIPKGRKKNRAESDIACAIREFHEETGITISNYHLFPAHATFTHTDCSVSYTNTYYFAYMKRPQEELLSFRNKHQVDEICDIRWLSLDEVRILAGKNMYKFCKPIFNYIRKRVK